MEPLYKSAFGALCLLLGFLILMAAQRVGQEAFASRIAPEILRFHVLANSNSPEDQTLKLQVKTRLLDEIYRQLGENASLQDTRNYISTHMDFLEQEAEAYMKELGYHYTATAELTKTYFPTKVYGDMVFPCGTYEALQIKLGSAEGKNWWCVLYPPLCFSQSSYAVVPDSSKEILKEALEPEDYKALLQSGKADIRLKLKLPQLVKDLFSPQKNTDEASSVQ